MIEKTVPKLGFFQNDSFDVQIQIVKADGTAKDTGYGEFKAIVEGLRGLPVSPDEFALWQQRDALYFRSATLPKPGQNNNAPRKFMSGVAITKERDAQICHVEGVRNNENDRRASDAMYNLWLSTVIPLFSRVVDVEQLCTKGIASAGFHFKQPLWQSSKNLINTFGLQDKTGSSIIPLSPVTMIGRIGWIDGWLGDTPTRELGDFTLVIEGEDRRITETQFYTEGSLLGKMLSEPGEEILIDSRDNQHKIVTPDYSGASSMAEHGFESEVIRTQLGLVTLKRAMLSEK